MWSVFVIVPIPIASSSRAPTGLESLSRMVSLSSSWASSSTVTFTVFEVSPAANVSVPETAV